MAALHFGGVADAYLEWAVASGYKWLDTHTAHPDQVDLLVQRGANPSGSIAVASSTQQLLNTGLSALPVWSRMELVQAVTLIRPVLNAPAQFMAKRAVASAPPVVLGLMDSGLGKAWRESWPMPGRKVIHWDMDASPAALSSSPALPQLPRISHGAHVLSWLAGQPPVAGAGFDHDEASQCPLVLVNVPSAAVDDPTGRWLGRHMLDGLNFMVAQALALNARKLVANISWGPQTGPHDGSSLPERALGQCIDRAQAQGLEMHVVLAAGNSRESRAYAQFDAVQGCEQLTWVVPPAGPAPFFLELWWPAGTDVSQVCVSVLAPDGLRMTLSAAGVTSQPQAHPKAHLVVLPHLMPQHLGGLNRPMALLALNPTGAATGAAAHGRWLISVHGVAGAHGQVQVRVARQAANMGGRLRGEDSFLDDPTYEQQRWRRRSGPPVPGLLVSREGTLSGLCSATHPQAHVAAGAVWSTGEPAAYSSEGSVDMKRPDWALPTDDTPLLQGVLGAGSRPGSAVRLVGTSMAAPQLARLLLNGQPSLPPAQPWDPRLGHGVATLGWTSRQRA
jgi:hypothetical protein